MSKKKYYSLSSYFSHMAKFKLRLFIVGFVFLISNISLAILPIFVGKLITAFSTQPPHMHDARFYGGILIAASIFHDATWRIAGYLYNRLLYPKIYRYENIVFGELMRKPYPFFVNKFSGKLSSYVNTISYEYRAFLETIMWNYIDEFVSVFVVGIILISINWQTGAIFFSGLILMLLVGRKTIKNSVKYEKIKTNIASSKDGKIVDAVANFVNVKSFHKEMEELQIIRAEQDKTVEAGIRASNWGNVFWFSMSFFIRWVIWPCTIALNIYLFEQGKISLADFVAFMTAIVMFSNFIWGVVWNISKMTSQLSRIEEAYTYMFGKVNIIEEINRRQEEEPIAPDFRNNLRLHSINFAYPDKKDTAVLHNINLEIKAGEKIGIVGKSGSGKTTLTKLLLDYYPDEDLDIFIDGNKVKTHNLSRLISYVPQDTSLFHRSIADNIAYASDNKVTRAQIIDAAKKAHADEFIQKVKKGYDAEVGERGVKLSAGQRQRIAIARAFLDDKPLLILDEATSALDSESEILIQEALEALWDNKTVIAIAHRLSTLRHMDRIIVMENGRIIEQGSHAELIKLNGTYAKLWNHQSGGFIKEN